MRSPIFLMGEPEGDSIMIQQDNDHLNLLVRELSKSNPNHDIIKSNTQTLGIPYNPDLIILMSDVLVYLSKHSKKKNLPKEKLA